MFRSAIGRRRAGALLATLAIASSGALAGCGGSTGSSSSSANASIPTAADGKVDETALIAAAKKEGKVIIYTGDAEDTLKIEAAEFKAKYGITVSYVRALNPQISARILSENKAGVHAADFYEASATESFIRGNPSLFQKLGDDDVPGWESYPANGKKDQLVYLRDNPTVIQYNTKLVPPDKVPTGWKDLLDPFWKGHLLLTDLTSSFSYMEWAHVIVQQYGIGYLQSLKAQNMKIAGSGTAGAQQVAAGTAYADFPARIVHSVSLRASGAPLKYQIIPGTSSPIFGAVFSQAPHKAAALLFASYLMSVEGQTDMCAKVQGTQSFYNIDGKDPGQQIPGCLPPSKGWTLTDFDVPKDEQTTILKAIGQQ